MRGPGIERYEYNIAACKLLAMSAGAQIVRSYSKQRMIQRNKRRSRAIGQRNGYPVHGENNKLDFSIRMMSGTDFTFTVIGGNFNMGDKDDSPPIVLLFINVPHYKSFTIYL